MNLKSKKLYQNEKINIMKNKTNTNNDSKLTTFIPYNPNKSNANLNPTNNNRNNFPNINDKHNIEKINKK